MPSARRDARALVIMLASLTLYLALDLGSKEWALHALSRETAQGAPVCEPDRHGYIRSHRVPSDRVTLVEGYLELRYAENCGAAFSMLRTAPSYVRAGVFGLAALVACTVLTTMFLRGAGGPLFAQAVPLVLSGALGNICDRLRHGYVVDFIRFHLQNGWEYPTFNVADVWIFAGVVLLFLDGRKSPAPEQRAMESSVASPHNQR